MEKEPGEMTYGHSELVGQASVGTGEGALIDVAAAIPIETPLLSRTEIRTRIEGIYGQVGASLESMAVAARLKIGALVVRTTQGRPPESDDGSTPKVVAGGEEAKREFPKKLGDKWHSARETVHIERTVKPRPATISDIPAMVDVDWQAFRRVHEDSGIDEATIRADQIRKFTERFERVGSKWIEVLEVDKKISGFIMACPTSKDPADFVSWEDTTDDGTLETTYDPNGKYLYVVSLATIPEASRVGGQDMLMGRMIGNIIAENRQTYFESRMPGFLRWAVNRCRQEGTKIKELDAGVLDRYAEEYAETRIEVDGEQVRADILLREYEKMGCKFKKIYSEAYHDSRSLNYGVLCTFDSPMPSFVTKHPVLRQLAGKLTRMVSASPWLTRKVF